MQWANQLFGGLLADGLSEEEKKRLQQGAFINSGLAMLANSGPSPYPTGLGQLVAQGVMAGRDAYGQGAQQIGQQRAAQAKAQQEQAFLQGLSPEQQQMARILGVGPFAKAQMEQQGRESLERTKANLKAPQTSSYYKAATDMGLTPGTPEHASMVRQLATQSKAPVVNVNTGAPQFKVGPMTPDEAQAEGLPTDRRWQRLKDGRVEQIAGTAPTKADEARDAKAPQAFNAGMLMDQMQQSLDGGLSTGPWNELFGIPVGRWSSQEKEQFEGIKEQLSSQVRAIFRIPGEGTLSDKEQAQYGLTLPSLDKRPETNKQLIENLRQMIARYSSQPQIVPNSSAAQQQGGVRIIRRVN